ncbi:hypothetical protein TEU_08170 [Thermococcus eurythermalis]|uniref:Uncharacterized protein n=1 Tax=Thermococcus eurythermalis TaxID=1505907 RepID=A0A097QV04_9EURY|nr:hypothetical protein [Thermococcus eurythermalis]AIU70306.1 hypothetical protein TEU_08170 [Thermococcus eurythermalis]
MGYIIFVTYDNDAERKRIDYLLDKWSSQATLKKPRGTVFYIETDNTRDFLEELFSRLEGNAEEKVEVYYAKKVESNVKARRRVLEYTINEEKKVVEKFIDYLLSKINSSYSHSEDDTKIYNVYTRKGRATIRATIHGDRRTRTSLEIEGYGDVVDFLAERIDEELKLFAGGGDGNI